MEDTFLEARPLGYLTISLIKAEMDNADKTASSCLDLVSASEDQGSPRGEGSGSLLAPKNITEVRVGIRTHVYLAKP